MKKYWIDKFLVSLTVAAIVLWSFTHFSPIIVMILSGVAIIAWILTCKPFILFPLDLLFGHTEKLCYFSRWIYKDKYDWFKSKYSLLGEFYDEKHVFYVIVPDCSTKINGALPEELSCNQQVIIKYYPISGIVISWKTND